MAEGLSFSVDADGILRLEFHEDFDDDAGADGIWNFAAIRFNTDADAPTVPGTDVPEPATDMLMRAGLALMGYTAAAAMAPTPPGRTCTANKVTRYGPFFRPRPAQACALVSGRIVPMCD